MLPWSIPYAVDDTGWWGLGHGRVESSATADGPVDQKHLDSSA